VIDVGDQRGLSRRLAARPHERGDAIADVADRAWRNGTPPGVEQRRPNCVGIRVAPAAINARAPKNARVRQSCSSVTASTSPTSTQIRSARLRRLADGGAEQAPDAVGERQAERSADDHAQDGAADVAATQVGAEGTGQGKSD
jgi:hypothetical protein